MFKMQIKTIEIKENESAPDIDKIETDLIVKAVSLGESIVLTEEELENMEYDPCAIEEARLTKFIENQPSIEIPEGSIIQDDYRPWAAHYYHTPEGLDPKVYEKEILVHLV